MEAGFLQESLGGNLNAEANPEAVTSGFAVTRVLKYAFVSQPNSPRRDDDGDNLHSDKGSKAVGSRILPGDRG